MVALLSLAVVDIPLVTTLGYTSALVVAVAVLAAITLLPALLAVVGDRIDRLRLPLPHRRQDDHPHGWLRWGEFVARHPLPSALVALVVLVALALPALDLYLGQQDNGALPESTDARRAYDGMTAGFGAGANGPLLVSVDMSAKPAKPDQTNLDKLDEQQQQQQGQAAADRRRARGAGRAAAQAQQQAQAQVRPSSKQLDKISETAQAGRAAGDRPAAAGPQERQAKTSGVKKVTEPLVN